MRRRNVAIESLVSRESVQDRKISGQVPFSEGRKAARRYGPSAEEGFGQPARPGIDSLFALVAQPRDEILVFRRIFGEAQAEARRSPGS